MLTKCLRTNTTNYEKVNCTNINSRNVSNFLRKISNAYKIKIKTQEFLHTCIILQYLSKMISNKRKSFNEV